MDFRPELCRNVTRRDHPAIRKEAALETLSRLRAADLEGFTDGSVLNLQEMVGGGGGYTLLDASKTEHSGLCAAGRRCNSFRAELSALRKLLDDLIAGCDDEGRAISFPAPRAGTKSEIRVALDSQSAIRALAKGPSAQTGVLEMQVWERLVRVCRERRAHVTVQYVPGHVELEQQEVADDTAEKAARTCEQEDVAVSLEVQALEGVVGGVHRRRVHSSVTSVSSPRASRPVSSWMRGATMAWVAATCPSRTARWSGSRR